MNAQHRASKGSVGIESFQGRLRLRLPRQICEAQHRYLTLGKADTPENRKSAELQAHQIELDITSGNFDTTLARYKPKTHLTLVKPVESPQKALKLAELWDKYTQFKSSQLEETTILRDYGKIQKRILKLPTQNLSEAGENRDYLLKTYSAEVAKRTLKQFQDLRNCHSDRWRQHELDDIDRAGRLSCSIR